MEHKWYIVHTISGSERKVKNSILEQASKAGMSELFKDIVIPSVEVDEIKRGKKVSVEKKIMPGYILLNMFMSDESWHLVKNILKTGGFLGGSHKPQPVSEKEVKAIFQQLESNNKILSNTLNFRVGESIKVVDGPFESFTGIVEDVDNEKSRLKVSVLIFGRSTPVDLSYNQVEKIVD